jgi:hypothetical protein
MFLKISSSRVMGDNSEDDDWGHEHPGQDRLFDADIGEIHGRTPLAGFLSRLRRVLFGQILGGLHGRTCDSDRNSVPESFRPTHN